MKQLVLEPEKKQSPEGTTIFAAMLERQRLISNHLTNGGSIRELKQMDFQFGKVDLRSNK